MQGKALHLVFGNFNNIVNVGGLKFKLRKIWAHEKRAASLKASKVLLLSPKCR